MSKKKTDSETAPLRIAVLAFEGISAFHLAVPCLVFGEDRSALGLPRFELTVCGLQTGTLHCSSGFGITPQAGLAALQRADIVIVPAWPDHLPPAPPALLQALRRVRARGAQLVALCLGAFVLAEAGLLDGRRATTHWMAAAEFAARHPAVQLEADALYVEDEGLLTSAGTAAALDCCLHLLRQRCGAELANRLARRLVVAPHRSGGQAQFVEQPLPVSAGEQRLQQLLEWMGRHLDQRLSLDQLAARALMSRRSFTRQFRQATGTTVQHWLLEQRLARARRLLETSDRPVERIAAQAGFGSALSLRQHFQARLGLAPSAYRRQYRA
ncbi:helix-turn-helix domain-containing protein [Roseateles sp. DAIF2]|uniref:GlxA family transcriptional regulator n=1 Tax=Roseateles sp. DAIF2 TaxID=2714952 RepID=UPI0018A253B9|nr:helix-turn-helix domain-containing protein [Roseateles sp. DAIF2]QPF71808.1 helix-turn-helix domain-containing protein [Roseateles sp. DAIF2]